MRFPVESFRGLNTVSDPLDLGLSWMTIADNCDITHSGRIVRRQGYAQSIAQTMNVGAYATLDQQRGYVVDAGSLKQINADLTLTTLATGLAATRMYFAEVNGEIFCTNGVDYRTIMPDGRVKRWGVPVAAVPNCSIGTGILPAGIYRVCATLVDPDGMEGSNSDVAVLNVTDGQQIIIAVAAVAGYTQNVYVTAANGTVFFLLAENVVGATSHNVLPAALGIELRWWFTDAPRGTMPCIWQGRCYLAEYFPDQDQTQIWFSAPLAYHHFDVGADGFAVPGRVLMLKAAQSAVIVGTERGIHAWDGAKQEQLAPYGVVEGHHDAMLDGKLYFWSKRGMVRALPFENLTERTASVAPGVFAGATVLEQGGNVRYIVALQTGGTAYNARPPTVIAPA